jgi:hypothetical protein
MYMRGVGGAARSSTTCVEGLNMFAHLLKLVKAQLLICCPEVVGSVGPVRWVVEGAPCGCPQLAHTHLHRQTKDRRSN